MKYLLLVLLVFTLNIFGFAQVKQNVKSPSISYQLAKGYFVKNNIKHPETLPSKITSKIIFDKQFGMAAVMGENGMPTNIDFKKQFVIAIIGKTTNQPTSYEVISLVEEEGYLTLRYQEHKDDPGTYLMTPVQLLVIDKKNSSKKVRLIKV